MFCSLFAMVYGLAICYLIGFLNLCMFIYFDCICYGRPYSIWIWIVFAMEHVFVFGLHFYGFCIWYI
jgi:hypothetical protein